MLLDWSKRSEAELSILKPWPNHRETTMLPPLHRCFCVNTQLSRKYTLLRLESSRVTSPLRELESDSNACKIVALILLELIGETPSSLT